MFHPELLQQVQGTVTFSLDLDLQLRSFLDRRFVHRFLPLETWMLQSNREAC